MKLVAAGNWSSGEGLVVCQQDSVCHHKRHPAFTWLNAILTSFHAIPTPRLAVNASTVFNHGTVLVYAEQVYAEGCEGCCSR
jgi:hypothetical protein